MTRIAEVFEGEPKPIKPSKSAWSRIERAYGSEIPPDVRSEIIHATSAYLFKVQCGTSFPVPDARKRIGSIQAHSRNLLKVLMRPSTKSAASHGELLIGLRFNQLWNEENAASDFARVRMVARALTEACILAEMDLAKWNQGRVDPWDGWTDAITRILAKAGMPRGLSKSKDTTFVGLIAGLQNLLPKEVRKHGQTRDSLVQALWRARKGMQEERKRREKERQHRIVEKERLRRLAYGRTPRVDTR
jgi:hypothetical protein